MRLNLQNNYTKGITTVRLKGATLVEALVSMSILTLMIIVISFVLSGFILPSPKTEVFKARMLLDSVIMNDNQLNAYDSIQIGDYTIVKRLESISANTDLVQWSVYNVRIFETKSQIIPKP